MPVFQKVEIKLLFNVLCFVSVKTNMYINHSKNAHKQTKCRGQRITSTQLIVTLRQRNTIVNLNITRLCDQSEHGATSCTLSSAVSCGDRRSYITSCVKSESQQDRWLRRIFTLYSLYHNNYLATNNALTSYNTSGTA